MLGIELETWNCAAVVLIMLVVVYMIMNYRKREGLTIAPDAPRTTVPLPKPVPMQPEDSGYNAYLQNQALETTVAQEHKKWLGEIPHTTTTSSHDIVLDGDRDIVPWVGLRRPKYRQVIPDSAEVRIEPTEDPLQMPDNKSFLLV